MVKNLSDAVQQEIRRKYSYLRLVYKNMYVVNESQKSTGTKGKVVLNVYYDVKRSVDQTTSLTRCNR